MIDKAPSIKDKAASGERKFDRALTTIRRKAVVNILRAWRGVAETARVRVTGEIRPDLPDEDLGRLKKLINECIDAKGGEVSARTRTVELGKIYLNLNDKGREKFLLTLAEGYGIDRKSLDNAIAKYSKAKGGDSEAESLDALRESLVTPALKVLRQFTSLPDGFKFLVDMRADILPLLKKYKPLAVLESDLKNLLASWFDIGLLDLEAITWKSPAALLEKLIEYEAVHEIRSWSDIKNRLDSDRRCFAFFQNKMPLEPLIFVEVALVNGLADNVQNLLDESSPVGDPEEADTAIFYSISNAQKGMVGISFGNFLIKRVVDKLSKEFKNLKNFATLSPVPGFRAWLDPQLAEGKENLFQVEELKNLRAVIKSGNIAKGLKEILDGKWHEDAKVASAIKEPLLRLCAHYITSVKKNGKAVDPVAHFHLTNGARLERVNWLGDTSTKGLKQSAGIMVNYYYNLRRIDDNHESYVTDSEVMASRPVRALMKE